MASTTSTAAAPARTVWRLSRRRTLRRFSRERAGRHYRNDSNGSPATVVLAEDNATDNTIDFGFYQPLTSACSAVNSGAHGCRLQQRRAAGHGRRTSPYTFSVVGTLPNGLTLMDTTTGAITGTPTASGTFTIQVTDANGGVGHGAPCPFTIVAAPSLTCPAVNSGEVGVAFNSPADDGHRRNRAVHILGASARCPPA